MVENGPLKRPIKRSMINGVSSRSGCHKGGRQEEFDHFCYFRSLFLMLLSLYLSLFYQTPFAGLLLQQGEYRRQAY